MIIGEDAVAQLSEKHVAVFGLGGVGSYAVEALARAGVGALTLVDDDVIAESNLNRQLYALHSTVGQFKATLAKARVLDINPACKVEAKVCRFDASTVDRFDFDKYDYVVDAIDTVTSKIALVEVCKAKGVPIICCMGTGNKLDATLFRVADISQTDVCPLAKVMRRELRKCGIATGVKVVYSTEQPIVPEQLESTAKRQTPGSVPFVPPVAGMILAGEVVKDLIE